MVILWSVGAIVFLIFSGKEIYGCEKLHQVHCRMFSSVLLLQRLTISDSGGGCRAS